MPTQEQDQKLRTAYELVEDVADEADDELYQKLLTVLHAFEDELEY